MYTCIYMYMYIYVRTPTRLHYKTNMENIVHNYGNRVGVLRCSCVYMLFVCVCVSVKIHV